MDLSEEGGSHASSATATAERVEQGGEGRREEPHIPVVDSTSVETIGEVVKELLRA